MDVREPRRDPRNGGAIRSYGIRIDKLLLPYVLLLIPHPGKVQIYAQLLSVIGPPFFVCLLLRPGGIDFCSSLLSPVPHAMVSFLH